MHGSYSVVCKIWCKQGGDEDGNVNITWCAGRRGAMEIRLANIEDLLFRVLEGIHHGVLQYKYLMKDVSATVYNVIKQYITEWS